MAGAATATGGAGGTGQSGTSAPSMISGGASGSAGVAAAGAALAGTGGAGTGGTSGSGGAGGAAGHGASGATGSAGTGGTGTKPSFLLGADISGQIPAPAAAHADLLAQLRERGFNAIRLRTFVDPRASDGYDPVDGYGDITHTVSFGKKVKDAGMALMIDFHYSDNWADPGKQCIPVAWQGLATIEALAAALHDYTADALRKLVAGGARPDLVQIGNETTPGMLLHRCDANGHPLSGQNIPVTGSASNWANLGALLKAGIQAVREVDPSILVAFHIDRGHSFSATKAWLDAAIAQGAVPDAFGESCYQKWQGDPDSVANTVDGWRSTFGQLAQTYPEILLFAAEYGPLQREINDVLIELPNQQGLGTFVWEPTTNGEWNQDPQNPALYHSLLLRSGDRYVPQPDLALYDRMQEDYASRLGE